MTEDEIIALRAKMKYALGTQFGELAPVGRTAAATNVIQMFIDDLLRSRANKAG